MNIKVTYAMTALEKTIWELKHKFLDEEFEPAPCRIQVKGLKPAVASYDLDWDKVMDCKAQTGLTEAEYQAKHHHAWSE